MLRAESGRTRIFWHWFWYGLFMIAHTLWVINYDSHHSKNESRMYQNQSLYSSFNSSFTPLNMLTLQLSILNRPSNTASNELISSNSLILYKLKKSNSCCQIRQFLLATMLMTDVEDSIFLQWKSHKNKKESTT